MGLHEKKNCQLEVKTKKNLNARFAFYVRVQNLRFLLKLQGLTLSRHVLYVIYIYTKKIFQVVVFRIKADIHIPL